MYRIFRTKSFIKSLSRIERSGKLSDDFLSNLKRLVVILQTKRRVSKKFKDHNLHGKYKGYRECHIKGDLLLIYKINDDKLILLLSDIGSHSSLF
jgi:mRNA interferase YafQ